MQRWGAEVSLHSEKEQDDEEEEQQEEEEVQEQLEEVPMQCLWNIE